MCQSISCSISYRIRFSSYRNFCSIDFYVIYITDKRDRVIICNIHSILLNCNICCCNAVNSGIFHAFDAQGADVITIFKPLCCIGCRILYWAIVSQDRIIDGNFQYLTGNCQSPGGKVRNVIVISTIPVRDCVLINAVTADIFPGIAASQINNPVSIY